MKKVEYLFYPSRRIRWKRLTKLAWTWFVHGQMIYFENRLVPHSAVQVDENGACPQFQADYLLFDASGRKRLNLLIGVN